MKRLTELHAASNPEARRVRHAKRLKVTVGDPAALADALAQEWESKNGIPSGKDPGPALKPADVRLFVRVLFLAEAHGNVEKSCRDVFKGSAKELEAFVKRFRRFRKKFLRIDVHVSGRNPREHFVRTFLLKPRSS